jgi:hypothetical protein
MTVPPCNPPAGALARRSIYETFLFSDQQAFELKSREAQAFGGPEWEAGGPEALTRLPFRAVGAVRLANSGRLCERAIFVIKAGARCIIA